MNIFDGLRNAVDAYQGGRDSLAPRLNKTSEVLRKELSGAVSHKLGAMDALAIARMCVELETPHCYAYAQTVAAECGGRFEIGDKSQTEDLQPMQRISALMQETSHVTATFVDALSDNKISDNELARIESEIAEAEAVLMALRHAARSINAAGKPAGERRMVDLPVRSMREEAAA
ncbi:phage regulatory CII family protein [Comamonas sp.]|uniref:phage regulatory CII family protein n=1 Tax=Comamonas sp. TaxID=34028 RepID=UPI0028997BE9|nr:phage regulatory CII family protein [Comamonas sp.]